MCISDRPVIFCSDERSASSSSGVFESGVSRSVVYFRSNRSEDKMCIRDSLYTLTDAESRGNLCMEREGCIAACQKTLETPELTDQMIAARANRLILDGRMRTYESLSLIHI